MRRVSRATGYPGDVKLFKKHDEAPPEDPAPSPAPLRPGQSARKGRPTPKRRQAQARGVHPVVPTDRKEARRQERAARDAAWKRQQEGMRAGDEHYMPTRDKGAIKRYIRDYVDARYSIGELALPLGMLAIMLTMFISAEFVSTQVRLCFGSPMLFLSLASMAMIVDLFVCWWRLRRRLVAKFGAQKVSAARRLRWYTFNRYTTMRIMRIPKPQVSRGQYPS